MLVSQGDVLHKGTVKKKQALSFNYRKEPASAPDFIPYIVDQLLGTFNMNGAREFVKGELQKKMEVRIFTTDEVKSIHGLNLVAGIPYLVFEKIQMST